MGYTDLPFPDEPTEAFGRFWDFGIEITELGTVALYGCEEAIIADQFNEEGKEYDISRVIANLNQMIFSRAVDNFQVYVIDLLLEIFYLRPETVPKGNVSYRELFSIDDIDEIRKIAIERTVSSYGFMNIVDLSHELNKNLNFHLFENIITQRKVKRIVEIRNLIIHNRAIINSTFKEKVGAKFDKFGDRVSVPFALRALRYLDRLAIVIDTRANDKFSLGKYRNG